MPSAEAHSPAVDQQSMSRREATRLRLQETQGVVMYADLAAHLERNAVFIVSQSVSLLECAVAVAMDDTEVVQAWIERAELRRPSKRELESWPKEQEHRWRAVVVQPYVLMQET